MSFINEIPLINQLFGNYISSILISILLILFIYDYIVVKSGIIRHFIFLINYKSIKIDKEIEEINELLKNTALSKKIRENLKSRLRLLQLQKLLGTFEKNIKILEHLSGFTDPKTATKTYTQSSDKIIFTEKDKKFNLNSKYSFNPNIKRAKIINSYIKFLYWALTLPVGWLVIYVSNVQYLASSSVSFYFFSPFALILFSIYTVFIAFSLRRIKEKANAVELLHMQRISY
ncbi:hypothetical protein [uncultured Acinetobacter sp.]|uniref:hypothetical protein n=1 Tax=uncultured Acinetobacter sp. TaxID=165433 RepID=UPI00258CB25E|nr:hypothetical protein [uncultured Acinetobacter sp.]